MSSPALMTHAEHVQQLIDDKYRLMRQHAACLQQLQCCQRVVRSLLELLDQHAQLRAEVRGAALDALQLTGTEAPKPTPARRRYEQEAAHAQR